MIKTQIYLQRAKVRVHIRQYAQDWIDKAVNIMGHSNPDKTTQEPTKKTTNEFALETENPSTNNLNESPSDCNEALQLYGKGTIITLVQDNSFPIRPDQVIQALEILSNGMKPKDRLKHNEIQRRHNNYGNTPVVFACAVPSKPYGNVHGANYEKYKCRYSPYSPPSKTASPELVDYDSDLEELPYDDDIFSVNDSRSILMFDSLPENTFETHL